MDGGATVLLRRHGNPDGTRLVLSHGIGLSIDMYYPFWSRLTDDFDVVVYDLRGHGWNAVASLSDQTIPTYIDDHDRILDEIDSYWGTKPQVGVFDLREMMTVDYDFLPDATHFLQLEKPAECVAVMRDFLEAAGLG